MAVTEMEQQQVVESIDAVQQTQTSLHKQMLWHEVTRYCVRGAFVAGMAFIGAVHGASVVKEQGANFQVADGIEGSVRPTGSSIAHVNVFDGILELPGVETQLPVVGRVSAEVHMSKLTLANDGLGALAPLINKPDTITQKITGPFVHHLETRAETEAGIGLLVGLGGLALLDGVSKINQDRRRRGLDDIIPPVDKLGRIALATFAIGASAFYGYKTTILPLSPVNHETMVPLAPIITQEIPMLKNVLLGAKVNSGSALDYLLNKALVQVLQEKQTIDNNYNDVVIPHLKTTLQNFVQDPVNGELIQNPNLVSMAVISGTHCSYPNATLVEPLIMSYFKPQVILHAGDYSVGAGTYPFEDNCPSLLLPQIQAAVAATHQEVYMVMGLGDHDPTTKNATSQALQSLDAIGPKGEHYKPILIPDSSNNFTVRPSGLVVVGAPDPSQTGESGPTLVNGKPESDYNLTQALGKIGDQLAQVSCDYQLKHQVKPIIIIHKREMGFQSALDGCAEAVFAGEGNAGDFSVTDTSGNSSLLSVLPSTAGNGEVCGIKPYETIGNDAETLFTQVDPTTNSIVSATILVIHPDGTSTIVRLSVPPKTSYDPSALQFFMDSYRNASGSTSSSSAAPDNC